VEGALRARGSKHEKISPQCNFLAADKAAADPDPAGVLEDGPHTLCVVVVQPQKVLVDAWYDARQFLHSLQLIPTYWKLLTRLYNPGWVSLPDQLLRDARRKCVRQCLQGRPSLVADKENMYCCYWSYHYFMADAEDRWWWWWWWWWWSQITWEVDLQQLAFSSPRAAS
jgi:hypothetical protein